MNFGLVLEPDRYRAGVFQLRKHLRTFDKTRRAELVRRAL